jgi:chemotaxis protein CheZ
MITSVAASAISPEEAFLRLGRITRQLHEAMSELGLEQGLIAITHEIPDARDRLSHVGQMTENAATRVLNVVDTAQPQCLTFIEQSRSMAAALQQVRTQPSSRPVEVSELLAAFQLFSGEAEQFAQAQSSALSDIMMAQDFQDLSGQVIKKVIDIISLTEQQLLSLLMLSAPEQARSVTVKTDLAGPQVPDKALKQGDVDDLLASFGF